MRRFAGARWAWIGGIAGALAVSGALVAVLYERGDSGSGGGDGSSGRPQKVAEDASAEPAKTLWRHTFSESYTGPVWITVESSDGHVRNVVITWGPWERHVVHQGTEPASYLFTKNPGPNVPLAVEVEPEAVITFGSGKAPVGAEDINADWVRSGN